MMILDSGLLFGPSCTSA